ncbi:MAG: hypothetical protein ABIQ88_06445 [Chitinophagaceae bacterium]
MERSKIQLSAEEMELVNNREWILTKHRVIEKVYQLFGSLSDQMQLHLQKKAVLLPEKVLQVPPKISKGELYKSLPYVVLDYPRIFSKEDVFAIRSFFWWGNYFSITLQLKGKYQRLYQQKIAAAITNKSLQGFYVSVAGNEFSFNLGGKNYFSTNNGMDSRYAAFEQQDFLKISYKISFEEWSSAEQKLLEVFQQMIDLTAG